MQVYVAMYKNYCSPVDGPGEVLGVYTSKKKAKKMLEINKRSIAWELGVTIEELDTVTELCVEKFELDWIGPW